MDLNFNSPLLENAVRELSKLPGIGSKTALRLALHLLRQDKEQILSLSEALSEMAREIRYCRRCHNISEQDVCPICADIKRDASVVCVVESIKDVITVEATHAHHGLYHVLGGLISPLDGVGPSDIEIDSLIARAREENLKEIILALSPTMEGDTTSFYLYRKLSDTGVTVSLLARGLSIGNELEYTDELTLGRSFRDRVPFSDTIHK